jgi:hypothetical protein
MQDITEIADKGYMRIIVVSRKERFDSESSLPIMI